MVIVGHSRSTRSWNAGALALIAGAILPAVAAYLLVFLAVATADTVPDAPTPPALLSAPVVIVVSAIALLIDVRTFFRRDAQPKPVE